MGHFNFTDKQPHPGDDPRMLSGAMFAFMLLITLLITLSPFHYQLPAHFFRTTYFSWKETIENIFFFFPLGYTLFPMLDSGKARDIILVFIVGLLISLFVEFNQAFIPGRFPSLSDVMENSLGALIGGALHRSFQNSDNARRLDLALEIPLANIVFLLIPLCWIDTVATGKELNRLWLLPALLLTGGFLQIRIFLNYPPLKSRLNFLRIIFYSSIWFVVAALPAFLVFPVRLLVFYVLYVGALSPLYLFIKYRPASGNRFEFSALKQIAPLFLAYIFALDFWPLTGPVRPSGFIFLPNYVVLSDSLTAIFRHLELLTAFTLIGYMTGQLLNRSQFSLLRLNFIVAVSGVFTVLLGAMHPGSKFSFVTAFLIYFCGLFGALIYQLQLHYFKWKRYQKELENETRYHHYKKAV